MPDFTSTWAGSWVWSNNWRARATRESICCQPQARKLWPSLGGAGHALAILRWTPVVKAALNPVHAVLGI